MIKDSLFFKELKIFHDVIYDSLLIESKKTKHMKEELDEDGFFVETPIPLYDLFQYNQEERHQFEIDGTTNFIRICKAINSAEETKDLNIINEIVALFLTNTLERMEDFKRWYLKAPVAILFHAPDDFPCWFVRNCFFTLSYEVDLKTGKDIIKILSNYIMI